MPGQLADGIYEELITAGLDALIREDGAPPHIEPLDRAESAEVLAAHLGRVATGVLDSLPFERRLSVANAIVDQLINELNRADVNDHVADGPKMLLSSDARGYDVVYDPGQGKTPSVATNDLDRAAMTSRTNAAADVSGRRSSVAGPRCVPKPSHSWDNVGRG